MATGALCALEAVSTQLSVGLTVYRSYESLGNHIGKTIKGEVDGERLIRLTIDSDGCQKGHLFPCFSSRFHNLDVL